MRGKIDLFAMDAPVNMATVAGLYVERIILDAVWGLSPLRCDKEKPNLPPYNGWCRETAQRVVTIDYSRN